MAPADFSKDGFSYDLPMAIAVLAANEQISPASNIDCLFVGELSLDSNVRPIRRIVSYV